MKVSTFSDLCENNLHTKTNGHFGSAFRSLAFELVLPAVQPSCDSPDPGEKRGSFSPRKSAAGLLGSGSVPES